MWTRRPTDDARRTVRAGVTVAAVLSSALWASAGLSAQTTTGASGAGPSAITRTTLPLEDGTELRYAIALPQGYERSSSEPRPLVLALHPGGGGSPYYGGAFMESIVEPALRSWGAILVAPDAPGRGWTSPRSEAAVLALLEHVLGEHPVDRGRILVTGFSMGGRGTWHMAEQHPDLFSGAIVMAGSPGNTDLDALAETPIYLIHSPDDEVVPFAGAEAAYRALSGRGHAVEMRVLPGAGHFGMGAYVPALRLGGEWMLARWRERPGS